MAAAFRTSLALNGWALSLRPTALGSRDRYIGWSAEARRHNIRFLAYNTRFLSGANAALRSGHDSGHRPRLRGLRVVPELTQQEVYFVTRMKEKAVYTVKEELKVPQNSNVVSDQIVYFPRLAREGEEPAQA